VLVAFVAFVVLAGANAIGVKLTLEELPPLLSAAVRFLVAGGLLLALTAIQRRPVPHGPHLLGTVLYGIFAFGLAYFFLYQALEHVGAGATMLMLAIVPLLTVLLAVAHRIEGLRPLGVAGAAIAFAGTVLVSANQVSLDVPIIALVMLVAAAASQAESVVIVKRLPPGDPVVANAIGMLLGGTILVVAAVVAGETLRVPQELGTWAAMAYLVGPGSIGVFMLALFVLSHWTASATSYAFLLFPLVAIVLGAVMLRESVEPTFLLGGLIVLIGVYLGAVYRPDPRERESDTVASTTA
jgi:drug/metabolite transporter (DMT)-like permease